MLLLLLRWLVDCGDYSSGDAVGDAADGGVRSCGRLQRRPHPVHCGVVVLSAKPFLVLLLEAEDVVYGIGS